MAFHVCFGFFYVILIFRIWNLGKLEFKVGFLNLFFDFLNNCVNNLSALSRILTDI